MIYILYMYAVSHLFIVDLHILTRQVEAEEKITPKKTGRFTPRIITPSVVEDTPALHKKRTHKMGENICVKMKSIQKVPTKWKDMYNYCNSAGFTNWMVLRDSCPSAGFPSTPSDFHPHRLSQISTSEILAKR